VQGHDIIGYTPRPQQSVAWSAQTLAHGATQLLFFRYRAAVFGQEEFCYGVRRRYARARTCSAERQS
jgi:beta-galactosidase